MMNNKKKVCLIASKVPLGGSEFVVSTRSLGLALIAASLRKHGYKVDILNCYSNDWDCERVVHEIQMKDYYILGFSVMGLEGWRFVKNIIRGLRKSGFNRHISLGGLFPTFYYDAILQDMSLGEIDSICTGEGEQLFLELVDKITRGENWKDVKGLVYLSNGHVVVNERRRCIENLDAIPMPADDEVAMMVQKEYPINMLTSRGCYGRCSYCSNRIFYGEGGAGWRHRSPLNVVDEIEEMVKKHNAHKFSFVDENFIGTGKKGEKRAIAICNEIMKRKLDIEFYIECRPNDITEEVAERLAAAGCKLVFLGIESGSDLVLKELGRGEITRDTNYHALRILNDNHIKATIGFIMFTPETILQDLRDNISFLREAFRTHLKNNLILPIYSNLPFTVLLPYRNTSVFEKLNSEGRIIAAGPYDLPVYVFTDPQVELIKRLLVDSNLYQLISSLESKVRSYLSFDLEYSVRKIIDDYEQKQLMLILDYVEQIILMVEMKNMKDFNKKRSSFLKNLYMLAKRSLNMLNDNISRSEKIG